MGGRDKRDGKTDLSGGKCWARRMDRRHGSGCRDVVGRGSHCGKEIGEVGERLVLVGIERRKRGGRGGIFERMDKITGGGQGSVGGGGGRHGEAGWKPRKGVSNTFGTCFRDPYAMAAIMVEGRAEIPTFNSMGGPGFASSWLDMN
jgi:hypothetical protein